MFSKIARSSTIRHMSTLMQANFAQGKTQRIAVTGAAGQISYALLFRIASGQLLGPNTPVILHLIDLPNMQNALKGVKMELDDCAFPLVQDIVITDNASVGFKDVDVAMLVGSKPRGPGMERADLLKDNGKIFVGTGKALNDNASRDVKVIVVGNPCNTNALIAAHYAKDLPKENFTAMTRLDHNRGIYQLSQKLNVGLNDIENFSIWGNHSPLMVPMITNTTAKGKKVTDHIDQQWLDSYFNSKVGKRGAEIIDARKASSAASAANAALEHVRDWVSSSNGWTSMAIYSSGQYYGIPKDLIFSFPVITKNGKYTVVENLPITDYYRQKLDAGVKELIEERNAVEHLLK